MEDFKSHPGVRYLIATLGAAGFAFLLVASLLSWPLPTKAGLKGFGFVSLGVAGLLCFGYLWWHRLPIRIKGGLSPARPFFYHLGSTFLLGVSLLVIAAGASAIGGWLGR